MPGDALLDEQRVSDDEVEFYWVGAEARIAGTLVHRWLELMATGRADRDPAVDRHPVTIRWLRETGIAGPAAVAVAARVTEALARILADERGRWLLNGEGHAELGLTGLHLGEVNSIVLDRVRIDDGVHWIVDYKTSVHEGGNLQGFLAAEVERYSPQLRKYAAIYRAWSGEEPRCALYFPLLQAFVEVEPG